MIEKFITKTMVVFFKITITPSFRVRTNKQRDITPLLTKEGVGGG